MKATLIATNRTKGKLARSYNLYATLDEEPTRYDWSTDDEHDRGRWCRFPNLVEAIQDAELVLER